MPENWGEFREMVVASPELTDRQRADLLELIDAPAYGPVDYDAKERMLKTDPRFARLYRDMILPKMVPAPARHQVCNIHTSKPMSDEQLARIIDTDPEMMSLNQMFEWRASTPKAPRVQPRDRHRPRALPRLARGQP